MRPILKTSNLRHSYGDTALAFPDIVLEEGGELLITGDSGKGKTTLLHLLGGLLKPQQGSIEVAGKPISSLSARQLDRFRAEKIGIVLQESHFVKSVTVFENLCLASWLATGKRKEERARELLESLGITEHQNKLPAQLSIGQQQRASIARALVNRPAILLADEPTSSLDDTNSAKVVRLLREVSAQTGAALMIVTHDSRLKNVFQNRVML